MTKKIIREAFDLTEMALYVAYGKLIEELARVNSQEEDIIKKYNNLGLTKREILDGVALNTIHVLILERMTNLVNDLIPEINIRQDSWKKICERHEIGYEVKDLKREKEANS